MLAFLALVAAALADVLTTRKALTTAPGLLVEANPLMRPFVGW